MNYPKMEEIHYQTRWMLENMDWLKYPQLEGISMKDRLTIGDFMIYIFFLYQRWKFKQQDLPLWIIYHLLSGSLVACDHPICRGCHQD